MARRLALFAVASFLVSVVLVLTVPPASWSGLGWMGRPSAALDAPDPPWLGREGGTELMFRLESPNPEANLLLLEFFRARLPRFPSWPVELQPRPGNRLRALLSKGLTDSMLGTTPVTEALQLRIPFGIYRVEREVEDTTEGLELGPGQLRVLQAAAPGADGGLPPPRWFVLDGAALAGRDDIARAAAAKDPATGQPILSIELGPAAAARFGEATAKLLNRKVAIVLGDRVVTAPVVKSRIDGGKLQVTGSFDPGQAERLATALASHALPDRVELESRRELPPSGP